MQASAEIISVYTHRHDPFVHSFPPQITELQRKEINKIEHTIGEAENEQMNQKKELDAVVGQRNILSKQLIKRNEELVQLYENIRVQQSTLAKGELHFKRQMDKRIELEDSINKMTTGIRDSGTDQYAHLKKELSTLEREYLTEKHKVKALSEELENPMNVHRWRKLEGSDPQVFALINKIKTLQCRIIQKTERVAQKENLIKEKDRAYTELKKILARQPGPEITESLALYQQHRRRRMLSGFGFY